MNKFNSNYFVEAGAGAGKTYTIVNIIANLLVEEKQEPSEIVAITFTNKSTQELYARITEKLEQLAHEDTYPEETKEYIKSLLFRVPEIQISTIHSFCETMLRTMPFESQLGADFEQIESMDKELRKYIKSNQISKRFDERLGLLGVAPYACSPTLATLVGYNHADINYNDFESAQIKPFREAFVAQVSQIHQYFQTNYMAMGEPEQKVINQEFAGYLGQSALSEDECYRFYSFIKGEYSDLIDKTYHSSYALVNYNKGTVNAVVAKANIQSPKLGEFIAILCQFCYKNKNCISGKAEKSGPQYTQEELAINAFVELKSTKELVHALAIPTLCEIAKEYIQLYRAENLASQDDLLTYTRDMLRDSQPARDYFHNKYKKIFVDEFQDTDHTQVELLFYLSAKHYHVDWKECDLEDATLFLVGDPKQAIYRFRGADLSIYTEVREKFKDPNCTIQLLEDNYRSTKEICDFVDQTFGKKGHTLHLSGEGSQSSYTSMNSIKGSDSNSRVYQYEVINQSANSRKGIPKITPQEDDVDRVTAFIKTAVSQCSASYGDFLILTARKKDSDAYTQSLRSHSIPCNTSGSMKYSDHLAVDNICKVIDFCANLNSNMELAEVLIQVYNCDYEAIRKCMHLIKDEESTHRSSLSDLLYHSAKLLDYNLGDAEKHLYKSLVELKSLVEKVRKESAHPMSLLEYIVQGGVSIYTDADDDYLKVINFQEAMREYKELDLAAFAIKMNEIGDTSLENPIILEDNAVRIMNIHKAKGLEGKIVILAYGEHKDKKDKISTHYQRSTNELNLCVTLKYQEVSTAHLKGAAIDWEQALEKEYQEECAERVRLMYVAVTRAKSLLLIATNPSKPSFFQDIAEGLDMVDEHHTLYGPAFKEMLNPTIGAGTRSQNTYNGYALLQEKIKIAADNIDTMPTIISPSQLNKSSRGNTDTVYEAPYGAAYGTIVHRVMELIALDASIDRLAAHVEKATREECGELQGTKQLFGKELSVPSEQDIKELCEKIIKRLDFLQDADNPMLQILLNKQLYPELRFYIQEDGQGKLGDYLKTFHKLKDVESFSVEGIIDLVYEDEGVYHIIDYKTDSIQAEETPDDYRARLIEEYSPQLKAYKTLLSEKKEVGKLYISAIPLAGALIEIS